MVEISMKSFHGRVLMVYSANIVISFALKYKDDLPGLEQQATVQRIEWGTLLPYVRIASLAILATVAADWAGGAVAALL